MHSTIGQVNGARRYTGREIEHAIHGLPKGWMADGSAFIKPQTEFWQNTLGPGTALLVGPSSAGKTTLSCAMGYAFATSTPLYGRRTLEQMGVAHILGEAAGGIPKRYEATRLHHGSDQALPIAWTANSRNLLDPRNRKPVIAELQQLSAYFMTEYGVWCRIVFIDTLASNFHFRDENNNAEMAGCVTGMQEIANAVNGLCIALHHPPKAGIGERGGGALRAGVDYVLTAACDRNDETGEVSQRKLALTKHRDGETGVISAFELKRIALGIMDAFGQEMSSVVAVPSDAQAASTHNAKPENATVITFRRSFDEALNTHGREHSVLQSADVESPRVMAAPVNVVRGEFYRRYATGESDGSKAQEARKKAFQRALKTLGSQFGREVLSNGDELVWRL